jgi:hypothetical protein
MPGIPAAPHADNRLRGPRASVSRRVALGGLAALACLACTASALARTLTLNEVGHLHLTSHRGFRLNEQGTASGAIQGPIYIHLNIVATNRVTAEVNIYPSGGSISGYAQASYHVDGPTASFSGTLAISRGSGTYSHSRGAGLKFTGTIQRSNDAVVVHLSGSMSY